MKMNYFDKFGESG